MQLTSAWLRFNLLCSLLQPPLGLFTGNVFLIMSALQADQKRLTEAKEYNRRFNVASKQSMLDSKDNYASDWTKYRKSTGPTFDRSTMQNVTVEKGQTAYLPCIALNQEDFVISWVRKNRQMGVITVGAARFIQDDRYSLPHPNGPSDWTLKIANVKLADGGVYECQIGTTPKTGRNVSLFIAGVGEHELALPSRYRYGFLNFTIPATRNALMAPSKSGAPGLSSHPSRSQLLILLCGLLLVNLTIKIRLKDLLNYP